ncbi:MAG: hypothetical protein HC888_09090 [Candidatus Competibacteraceae bacterium]|nr:hypothetical protein [Candidatus Competibacteraceae bacterium]
MQTYPDTFHVTGVQIMRSSAIETAIFATPDTPNEDNTLFHLLRGLRHTFLEGIALTDQPPGRTMLEELQYRFDQVNTPPEQKFGITSTVVVDRETYGHVDAAMADITQARVINLLNREGYATVAPQQQCVVGNETFPCTSLVLALEQQSNIASMDDVGVLTQSTGRSV